MIRATYNHTQIFLKISRSLHSPTSKPKNSECAESGTAKILENILNQASEYYLLHQNPFSLWQRLPEILN
jgi:hypothetical protein